MRGVIVYPKQYFIYLLNIIITGSIILLLSACSHRTAQAPIPKQESVTKLPKGKAPLLNYLEKTDKKLANNSAFYPLPQPTDAFAARLFLIDNATTSLDVQYYIYKDDRIGKVFTAHLLLAAQRGVKVRILIDDMITSGKDEEWEKLALHPNIELRLFNPNRLRTSFRNIALLLDVNRLGRRMHNKALVADGSAAIIGGRNIGNVYFASSKETLFIDYDVLVTGKVIPDIYKAFDIYWNSKESVPSKEIFLYNDPKAYLAAKKDLEDELKAFSKSSIGKAIIKSDFNQKIAKKKLKLIVAKRTDLYYDHPSKVNTSEEDNSTHISSQISEDLKHVENDLVIISPYFIPSDRMMARLKILRESDVEVTVITNSLASTDVFLVYGGYKGYIKALVEMGVKLYEVKPHSFKKFFKTKKWANHRTLSLHTKMMILDNNRMGIGSANMDPRSDKLNTEIFMIVSSEKLAKEQRERLAEAVSLKNLYKLSWGEHPKVFDEDVTRYGPIWHTIEEGKETIYYSPPHTGFWKKIGTNISSFLPIKGYL
ncbi:phospholipase D family protein [Sulfurovum sp. CS9]|uniref:phospholipase D family protein n=1 Tax=Sulfurovum sp. CS9 TaxID=3391146 RepID=UPI0039E83D37